MEPSRRKERDTHVKTLVVLGFFLFLSFSPFVQARAARHRTAAAIIRAARRIKGGAAVFEEVEGSAVFEASRSRAAEGGRRSHGVSPCQQRAGIFP